MSERSRIVEGKWRCTSCDTGDIPARHQSCPHCNNPREEGGESKFDFGERSASGGLRGESVSEEEHLEAARAGEDWLCEFCQTANPARGSSCRHCGAQPTQKRLQAQLLAGHEPPPPPVAPPPKKKGGKLLPILGGIALAVAAFFVWATRSTELTATRVGARWERVVHLEQFSRVTKEGWEDELRPRAAVMPVNGGGELPGVENIRECRRAQRGTRKVAAGTERVCSTRTRKVQCGTEERCEVKDLGNGFAEEKCRDVPKYCSEDYEDCRDQTRYRDEPVFAQQCRYDTWQWQRVRSLREEGSDAAPRWPTAAAPEHGRVVREERYEVLFSYRRDGEPETWRQEATTEADFARWAKVNEAVIRVSNLGKVQELRPK